MTIYQRIMLILDDKQVSVNALSNSVFPDVSAEWVIRGVGTMYHKEGDVEEVSYMVAEEPKHEALGDESHQDDSVWKAKYEELEKRYDQLLSILGGGMRKANVG